MNDQHVLPIRVYLVVYVVLLVLLVVTVAVAELHLGAWTPVVALSIAVVKGLVIALYFMHLRYEPGLIRLFAAAGFLWLAFMLGITISDYLTRGSRFITLP